MTPSDDRSEAENRAIQMASRPSLIERAYQLARSGDYPRLVLVKAALRREGYEQITAHFAGSATSKALRIICEEAYRLKQASGAGKPE